MRKMATQESEQVEGNRIKRILEDLTDDKYVLKTRAELVHPGNVSWYLHLPVGKPGYISPADETDGRLILESPTLDEVFKDMEHHFSESKYVRLRGKLRNNVERLQDKEVRNRYREMIPMVVDFLDALEEIVSKVNRLRGTQIQTVNHGGWMRIKTEIEVRKNKQGEADVERTVLAMKEVIRLVTEWQEERRD